MKRSHHEYNGTQYHSSEFQQNVFSLSVVRISKVSLHNIRAQYPGSLHGTKFNDVTRGNPRVKLLPVATEYASNHKGATQLAKSRHFYHLC